MSSVSIVLATYNGAKYLERQLQSLAWQTRLPDELVVNDDLSTDDTVAILHRFAESAPFPVRIGVNEHKLDYRANFYKGAGLSTSDLVMFCDQDDIWRPEKVETIVRVFDRDPALLLAYHQATIVDGDERPLAPISDPARERAILAGDVPPPWHFARGLLQTFRRELLRFDDLRPLAREHFNDGTIAHDFWYFTLALGLEGIGFVDWDLLMYRQHGANLFGADQRRGFWGRIANRLRYHPESDFYAAQGARSRTAVFEAMIPRVEPAKRARLERLALAYRTYAERLERRHATYTSPSVPARMIAFARSLAHGDYLGNPWGFDPRSVVRDMLMGVSGLGPGSNK